ncbi:hypothetical protein B566_EDAN005903 [Ephemera danica]|nr:hypothetical protein B566_EDAN005903 [Ephemera danica]
MLCGWLRRCFWGVLDWPGVTQWLMLAILTEPDTVLYLAVAMLRFSRARILALGPPVVSLDRFNVGEALPLIETLTRRHRHKVLPYLQAALTASTSTSLMNLA